MGNRRSLAFLARITSVHPHTYGEQGSNPSESANTCGSSPYVWGTAGYPAIYGKQPRFIPIRMGNREYKSTIVMLSPVHPHTYGEQAGYYGTNNYKHGSSPYVWGTAVLVDGRLVARRFIPIRMGNSQVVFKIDKNLSVHPHTYGEQCKKTTNGREYRGSSPYVWGTD